ALLLLILCDLLLTDLLLFFFSNHSASTDTYTLSLHDALPISDFHNVFHQVYENVAFKKLKLKAPAFERAQVYEGGRLVERRCLRSEEHTSELQSPDHLVCRLLLEKKKKRA